MHPKERSRRGLTHPDGSLTTRKGKFPVVLNDSSGKNAFPQIPGCYPDRQRVCAGIDAPALRARLPACRPTGRPGYPLLSFWRAYIARYVLNRRDTNDRIRRLPDAPGLRAVCGFNDTLPPPAPLLTGLSGGWRTIATWQRTALPAGRTG